MLQVNKLMGINNMKKQPVIRVGTLTNFNCSQAEFDQLKYGHHNKDCFINTNIRSINDETAKRINENNYPVVVTINPDIDIIPIDVYLDRLAKIDKSKVAFVRLKYIPTMEHYLLYDHIFNMGYRVVITPMRFRRKETFKKYIPIELQHKYEYKNTFYRLIDSEISKLDHMRICDRSGKGCPDCNFCSLLTFGRIADIYSLDLSTSGKCKYNCPDCFAKLSLARAKNQTPTFDTIKRNRKQRGK